MGQKAKFLQDQLVSGPYPRCWLAALLAPVWAGKCAK